MQVAEYYANHGTFPEDMSDLGLVSSQGSFIGATALGEKGAILATFGNDANKNIVGGMVSLTPVETSKGNLEWTCEANIEEKYIPTSCKVNENINNDNQVNPPFDLNDYYLKDGPYSDYVYKPHLSSRS